MAAPRFGTGMHGSGPPMARSVAPGGGEPSQRVGGVGSVELAALEDRVGGLGGVEVAAVAAASTIASEAWVARRAWAVLCAGVAAVARRSPVLAASEWASWQASEAADLEEAAKVEDGTLAAAFFTMAGWRWWRGWWWSDSGGGGGQGAEN